MDEIGGAVEWVDDPGGVVGEVGGGAQRRRRLLPDELVVRVVLAEVVEDEVLAGLVCLRHQIHLPQLSNTQHREYPNRNPLDGTQCGTSASSHRHGEPNHKMDEGEGEEERERERGVYDTWPLCSTFLVW